MSEIELKERIRQENFLPISFNIGVLQNTLIDIIEMIKNNQADVNNMKARLEQEQDRNRYGDLASNISRLENEMKAKNNELQNSVFGLKDDTDSSIQNLKVIIEQNNIKIMNLEGKIGEMGKEFENKQDQLIKAEKSIEVLSRRITELENHSENPDQSKKDIKDSIDTITFRLSNLDQKYSNLEQKTANLEASDVELDTKITRLNAIIENKLKTNQDTRPNQVSVVKEVDNDTKNLVRQDSLRIDGIESTLNDVFTNIDGLKKHFNEEMKAYAKQSDLTMFNNRKDSQISEIKTSIDDIRSQFASFQQALIDMSNNTQPHNDKVSESYSPSIPNFILEQIQKDIVGIRKINESHSLRFDSIEGKLLVLENDFGVHINQSLQQKAPKKSIQTDPSIRIELNTLQSRTNSLDSQLRSIIDKVDSIYSQIADHDTILKDSRIMFSSIQDSIRDLNNRISKLKNTENSNEKSNMCEKTEINTRSIDDNLNDIPPMTIRPPSGSSSRYPRQNNSSPVQTQQTDYSEMIKQMQQDLSNMNNRINENESAISERIHGLNDLIQNIASSLHDRPDREMIERLFEKFKSAMANLAATINNNETDKRYATHEDIKRLESMLKTTALEWEEAAAARKNMKCLSCGMGYKSVTGSIQDNETMTILGAAPISHVTDSMKPGFVYGSDHELYYSSSPKGRSFCVTPRKSPRNK